jgi:hypothetical protein
MAGQNVEFRRGSIRILAVASGSSLVVARAPIGLNKIQPARVPMSMSSSLPVVVSHIFTNAVSAGKSPVVGRRTEGDISTIV